MEQAAKKYEIEQAKARQIENSFTYHTPKEDQPLRYTTLRNAAKDLAYMILLTVPPGREQSTAITKLEEAIMWANKGIACGE